MWSQRACLPPAKPYLVQLKSSKLPMKSNPARKIRIVPTSRGDEGIDRASPPKTLKSSRSKSQPPLKNIKKVGA